VPNNIILGFISCEGPCMRSFHAHSEAGKDSNCKSLGFRKADLEVSSKPSIVDTLLLLSF